MSDKKQQSASDGAPMNQFPTLTYCAHCGRPFKRTADPHTTIQWRQGDMLVCIRCGGVSIFTKTLTLRRAGHEEIQHIRAKESGIGDKLDREQAMVRRMNALESRNHQAGKAR